MNMKINTSLEQRRLPVKSQTNPQGKKKKKKKQIAIIVINKSMKDEE